MVRRQIADAVKALHFPLAAHFSRLEHPKSRTTLSTPSGLGEHPRMTEGPNSFCASTRWGIPQASFVGKVYRKVSHPEAEAHNMIRIVAENLAEPEGYFYPASMFVPVELTKEAKRALVRAGTGS